MVAVGRGLAKGYGESRAGHTRLEAFVRGLAWLAALGLLVSVLANVWGAMALATLLSSAVLNAIWAAVAFRVAINVLSALLKLLLRSPLMHGLRSVRDHGELLYLRIVGLLQVASVIFWIVLVLGWLQLRSPILSWGRTALQYEWIIGTLQINVSGLVAFVLVLVIAALLSRLVRFFLEEEVLGRLSMPRGATATVSTVLHYTIVGVGVVIAFAASGLDLSKLGFIIGALGVGIGFGLQSIVNNFVSGLILIAERPIKVGDLIELTGTKGHVMRIGARASTIRTFGGAEIIIPNGDLISSQVTNWTLTDQKRRASILVPVAMGADPQQVMEILKSVAGAQEIVLEDPAPYVAFQSFGEQGMMFELRAWPTPGNAPEDVVNALAAAVLPALRDAGIEVPLPQREVLLRHAGQAPDGST
jgi:small-conductance mechanosensitive channel